MIADWDDAYANAAHIPGADQWLIDIPKRGEAFHAAHDSTRHSYGTDPRAFYDLYRPETPSLGLVFMVHGGYWMRFSARDFAYMAGGPLAAGWTVAMVNYPLAPHASLPDITTHIATALTQAATEVPGDIRLVGHSAGGHLVTRAMCEDAAPSSVQTRVVHTLTVSGVHDLRPLMRTELNTTLKITDSIAKTQSPALLHPAKNARVTCVVGANERPEFVRQSALLANIWTGLGAACANHVIANRHHFDIIEGLAEPGGDLTEILLG